MRGCLMLIGSLGANDVYIGREHKDKRGRCLAASKWGNPFLVRDGGSQAAIEKFEAHLRASPQLMADIPSLAGKRLVCHCRPMSPCHGDVLIKVFVELMAAVEERDCTLLVGIYRDPT